MIELLKKNEDRIKTDESLLRNISYLNQLLKYSTIPETLIPDFESYMKRYEIRRKLKENGELIDDPNYLLRLFLIWMKLYEQQNDPRYLNVTLKGIDELMEKECETDSFYELILKVQSTLSNLSQKEFKKQEMFFSYEIKSKTLEDFNITKPINISVVILSGQVASLTNKLVQALIRIGLKPQAIIIDTSNSLSYSYKSFYRYGLGDDFYKQYGHCKWPWYQPNGRESVVSAFDTAKEYNLVWDFVDNINSIKSEQLLKRYKPDICILSSIGIIRKNIIALPKIGILNAHSGILPAFRGIDTVAWGMLERNPIGCSVHFIDEHVDTGDILFTHMLSYNECLKGVKVSLKQAKIKLLLMALSRISDGNCERHHQDNTLGKIYFRMHPIIKFILNKSYAELGTKAFCGNVSIK